MAEPEPRGWFVMLVMAASLLPATGTGATEFDPRIVTFGESRQKIKATPIESRPNRPLHVYGNTLRRRHGRSATPAGR